MGEGISTRERKLPLRFNHGFQLKCPICFISISPVLSYLFLNNLIVIWVQPALEAKGDRERDRER